jgi:hypothetical protein
MGWGLVIDFIELLKLITIRTIVLSLIHTLCNSLQHILNLLSLLCLQGLLPGNSPNTVDPSVSVLPGSRPCRLASVSQLDSALLCNDLQQWGLLHLPHLCKGQLSQTACLRAQLRLTLDWLSYVSIAQIWPLYGPTENTASHSSSIVASLFIMPLLSSGFLFHSPCQNILRVVLPNIFVSQRQSVQYFVLLFSLSESYSY